MNYEIMEAIEAGADVQTLLWLAGISEEEYNKED